jgi:quercetin dioxygenase-like cupin family protein
MPPLYCERWDRERDGAPSAAWFRDKLCRMGYRVSQYTYPPGTVFPPHSHGVDKIDVVLSGRFRMSVFGQTVVLEAGDSLLVPKGAVHSAEVVGEEPVVSLDAVRLR